MSSRIEAFFTIEDKAKYPFTLDALEYARSRPISLEDLGYGVGKEIVRRAVERIVEAIERREVTVEAGGDIDVEILSFPVSILLLRLIGDKYLINKYAVAESKRVGRLLRDEDWEKLLYIASRTLGWKIEVLSRGSNRFFVLSFLDYVENLPQHSKEWKLVNRRLEKGKVFVRKAELARLIEEAVKKIIISRATDQTTIVGEMPDSVSEAIEQISRIWSRYRREIEEIRTVAASVGEGGYPPCIKALFEEVKNGKNIPHAGRFALTTFLLSIGWQVDEVVELFRALPDFNESITRYQVEHLAGLRGSRVRYSTYKCANMKTFGLCPGEPPECRNVKHPLQYYFRAIRRTAGRRVSRGGSQTEPS